MKPNQKLMRALNAEFPNKNKFEENPKQRFPTCIDKDSHILVITEKFPLNKWRVGDKQINSLNRLKYESAQMVTITTALLERAMKILMATGDETMNIVVQQDKPLLLSNKTLAVIVAPRLEIGKDVKTEWERIKKPTITWAIVNEL